MGNNIRILHTIASHRWTGAAEPAVCGARREIEAGADVLLAVTPGRSLDEHATEAGVTVARSVPFGRSYLPWRKCGDLRCLRALIRDFKPNVAPTHLTHDHVLSAAAMVLGMKERPALVRSYHRQTQLRRVWLQRNLLTPLTDGAITVCDYMTQQCLREYGFHADQVIHLPAGIPIDRFRPTERGERMRRLWKIPADAPVAGLVSRIREARGHKWLLEAAVAALARQANGYLVICGRGNWQREMLEVLETHPHRERIIYAGYLQGRDLEDAYNAFDLTLLLRPGNDGGCRAALEGMACGKPLLCGNIPSLVQIINSTGAGWHVPDKDTEALATALAGALSSREDCRERGVLGRRYVEEHHDELRIATPTIPFYHRLLARRESLHSGASPYASKT